MHASNAHTTMAVFWEQRPTIVFNKTRIQFLVCRLFNHVRNIRHLNYLLDNEYAELWIFNEFTVPTTPAFGSVAILNNKIHLIRTIRQLIRNYDANYTWWPLNNTLKSNQICTSSSRMS